MYICHVVYRCYSCQILTKLEYSGQIFENTVLSNFVKIRIVGAKFYADGTYTTKLIVAFHNFANAPEVCHPRLLPCKCLSYSVKNNPSG